MTQRESFSWATVSPLVGYRILIVEDEHLAAWDIQEMLTEAGAEPLCLVGCVADALQLIATMAGLIDAALLDVNLRGKMVWPVVDLLLANGVPVVLTTAFDASSLPTAYAHLPRCQKPASKHALVDALRTRLPDTIFRIS